MAEQSKKNVTKKIAGMGIRTKLLFWMLLIALVPMVIIGVSSYSLSSGSLEKQSFDNLASTLTLQKKSLEDYFSERTRNLENLVDNVQVQQQEVFAKMEAIKSLKKKQVEDFFRFNLQNIAAFVGSPQQRKVFTDYAVKGNSVFNQYQSLSHHCTPYASIT